MLDERHALAVLRNTGAADPERGLVNDAPGGIFETTAAIDEMNHRHGISIGRPIGVPGVLHQLANAATRDRGPCERARDLIPKGVSVA